MTTNTDAANRLAKELGLAPGYVQQLAKALRSADDGLWPSAGHGGGRAAAHVGVSHLRNLLIACLASDLVKDAVEITRRYGAMKAVMTDLSSQRDVPEDLSAIPFPFLMGRPGQTGIAGLTFGAAIDSLINAHADPTRHPKLLELPFIIKVSRTTPTAKMIVLRGIDSKGRSRAGGNTIAVFRAGLSADRVSVPSPLLVEAQVRETVCAACAEMVADTRWRELR